MSRLPASIRRKIDEAVRIVDEGVEYGLLGIDAPPEVGRRAAAILEEALAEVPDNVDVRYLHASTLFLAGRIDEAREQLGAVVERDRDNFDAIAELDHPEAWRHVFLCPPWSEDARDLPPIAANWLEGADGLVLVGLRQGAERIVSLVGYAPPALLARTDSLDLPVALDFAWRTRQAGPFIAFHVGVGGPAPENIEVADGFEFPWPEGKGHRHELLIAGFLRQARTFVVLADVRGRVAVNRLLRLGPRDAARCRTYLTRLATARVRTTDTRDRVATIARYREEFPPAAVRGRLAVRLRGEEAPIEEEDAEVVIISPRETPAMAIPTVRSVGAPAAAPARVEAAAAGRDASPAAVVSEAEADVQSALLVAGLWRWTRRERWFAHAVPIAMGLCSLAAAAFVLVRSAAPAFTMMIAGGVFGLVVGAVCLAIAGAYMDRFMGRCVLRLIADSRGTVTRESMLRVTERRGAELLPGWAGARVRRRLRRILRS